MRDLIAVGAELLAQHSDTPALHHSARLLVEEVLRLFEKALAQGAFLAAAEFGEFLEFGFLGGIEMGWHLDIHPHVQITMAIALYILDALSLEPEHRAGLSARRDLDAGLAVERRYFDLGAQGGLNEADRHLA